MRTLCLLIAGAAGLLAENLSPAQVEDIIRKFAAKETEFAKAREAYTYRQSARIQVLDDAGTARERWEMVSDIVFSGEGKRSERVVRAPVSTLQSITLEPQDLQDMRDVQPFVLTTADLPKYRVHYLGPQKVDEIGTFVFAVKPKTPMAAGQRYFAGLVWVDDRDLQIVKSYGRGVGLTKKNSDSRYPKFETFREQIDGKFWFPTYTIANDTLRFDSGDVRIRQTIRYEDYKQFGSETRIIFGDEVKDDAKPGQPPANQQKK